MYLQPMQEAPAGVPNNRVASVNAGLSTRMTTDTNGVVKGTQDHMPFGEDPLTSAGQVEKHKFTNYERDSESNTDYAVNRQYSQGTGRFNQPDPIAGSIPYPQSLNRYSYVRNDATNSTDPLGLVENVWSLWAGFGLLATTNVTWDGATVPQYMLGMVAHLWMSGGADIIPFGATRNRRGDGWIIRTGEDESEDVSELNDYWRSLPQIYRQGPLWNNARGEIQGRLDDLIRKLLSNQKCVDWFNAQSSAVGHGADLPALLSKTGLNFYVSGDQVSLTGLNGLNTSRFGVGEGFGQTLFGGTGSPQVVINRSAFDNLNNGGIVKELIHEMFHAAGLHGSDPKGSGFLGLFTPNDLNPEVSWADIKKNCVDGFAY